MRIVERAGTSLKRQLQRSNPFRPKQCERSDCLICQNGGKGNCQTEGITYDIECLSCGSEAEEGKYTGNTSQNAYTRGKKHLSDLSQKQTGSVLWKHALRKHSGTIPDYRMNVTGIYRQDSMIRQIAEAVRIDKAGLAMLMNDKTEWQINRVPQLTTER